MLRFGHQYSFWVYNLTLHQPRIFLLLPSTRLHVLKYFVYQNRIHLVIIRFPGILKKLLSHPNRLSIPTENDLKSLCPTSSL